MRQRIPSAGHRHREDRADTGQPPVPRQPLLVFTMTPHTTRMPVLTHSDAADPIPNAAQQAEHHLGRWRLDDLLLDARSKPASAA
jgi:hypothetical protein